LALGILHKGVIPITIQQSSGSWGRWDWLATHCKGQSKLASWLLFLVHIITVTCWYYMVGHCNTYWSSLLLPLLLVSCRVVMTYFRRYPNLPGGTEESLVKPVSLVSVLARIQARAPSKCKSEALSFQPTHSMHLTFLTGASIWNSLCNVMWELWSHSSQQLLSSGP
jgi:hypothetical protein